MTEHPSYSFAARFVRLNIKKKFWGSASTFLGFVSPVIMLTAFSVYEFGLYQLVLAAVALADAFSVDFFDEVVQNDISHSVRDDRRSIAKRLFHELAFFKVGLGIVSALALFICAALVAKIYGEDIATYIRIASVLVVIRAVRSTADLFLRSVVSLRSMGASVVEDVAKLSLVSGFFFFSELSVGTALIATLFGASVALIYVGIGFLRDYFTFFSGVESAHAFLFKGVVKMYGKWILLRAAIKRSARSIRPWLIVTLLNVEAVGLYTLAANMVTMVKDLFPTAGSSLIAWEARNKKRLAHIFNRGVKYSFLYGLALAGVSFFLIVPVVSIFFPKYLLAMPLVSILLLSVPLHGVQTLETDILTALREQKILTTRIFSELMIGYGFVIALVPLIGILATAVGPVAVVFWRTWFLYRRIVEKYPELRFDAKILFRFDEEDRFVVKRALVEARLFLRRQPKNSHTGIKT